MDIHSYQFNMPILRDIINQTVSVSVYVYKYEDRLVEKGLPHTSNLPTLTIHNFRLVQAINLKFYRQKVPT